MSHSLPARVFGSLAALFAFGCAADPVASKASCVIRADCDEGEICAGGRCIDEGPTFELDAGAGMDRPPFVFLDGGDVRRDAGSRDSSTARDVPTSRDATTYLDATGDDAASTTDGSSADAGASLDAAFDAGVNDSGLRPDAGSPGPAVAGIYDFSRVTSARIPSGEELTRLAIAPDGRTLVVAAHHDRVHLFDIATNTSTVTLALPKDRSEPIRIEAVSFAKDGSYALVAGTASLGQASTPEGRLYRIAADASSAVEVGTRASGTRFQAMTTHPDSAEMYILGHRQLSAGYVVLIQSYDDTTRQNTPLAQDFVQAGCNDIVAARDAIGGIGLVFSCGTNGGAMGVFDSTGTFGYGPELGNTTHLAARPGGDYVLAVTHSEGVLPRFAEGTYTVGFGTAPSLGTSLVWNIGFSSDGARALVTGQYSTADRVAILREYRHGLYDSASIGDVSIPAFHASPWSAIDGVTLHDVAWRPDGDCGYIVGGCSSYACARGYLIAFEVVNGRACP